MDIITKLSLHSLFLTEVQAHLIISIMRIFILAILSALFFSAVAQVDTKEITFEDIGRHGKFAEIQYPEIQNLSDGKHYVQSSGSRILKYEWETGEFSSVMFSLDQLSGPSNGSIDGFEFSADNALLLITTNRERIYRHSFLADYHVYDFESGSSIHLTENGKIQLAGFSPEGKHVSYVRNNNLFVFDLENRKETQITYDGEFNKIINGAPDWVYEEEFRFSKAYAWSPNGRYIAFYRTDESRVREFTFNRYGDLYPDYLRYKYPKAGEMNSLVSIHVFDLEKGRIREMDTGTEEDQYIPRIKWTKTPGLLAISRLNRLQNRFDLILADAATGIGEIILTETNEKFITEPTDDKVIFLDDGQHFLFFSELDGYYHYYLHDMSGKPVRQVTRGEWDVIEFLGLDESTGTLYYSSHEESSIRSAVYSISLGSQGKRKISDKPGWNTALFSPGFDHFLLKHTAVKNPETVSLHRRNGKLVNVLHENIDLKMAAMEYGLPQKELISILTPDGVELNAYMYKPKNFNPEHRYPVMMFVYGGPESQEVRDEWGTSSWHYLLLQKGYVIVCADNRGTNGKGEEFRKSTYLQLGKLELEDQIAVAKDIGSLDYVDAERIGIWGSSYGGYMSSLCITKGNGVFRLAIAISPVTNWRYYDTIYTERFMRTPQENPDGYDENSPLFYADHMQGKFMLAHGMVDDNVHFQNSVDFSDALIGAGKDFEILIYRDNAHGFRGKTGLHLRKQMTRFVLENL